MPRKKREKRQWTEPIIIVPIIVAVITAIVSPIVVPLIQDMLKQEPRPPDTHPSPTPTRVPTPPVRGDSLSVSTDKISYGFGDSVTVSGIVDKPVQGKSVRLDVYEPGPAIFNSYVFDPSNISTILAPDKPQSNIVVSLDEDGSFSYSFPLSVISPEEGVKGNYTVDATYEGLTKNTTFTVR